jgi:hypothetical protein
MVLFQNCVRQLSHQDGHHSAFALLLKAALIQVSDCRLLGASGFSETTTLLESKQCMNNQPCDAGSGEPLVLLIVALYGLLGFCILIKCSRRSYVIQEFELTCIYG